MYICFASLSFPECLLTWWRHQMETFFGLLAICAGNSPVPGEFLAQRPVTRSFDVFFDLRLNKWLNKQSWGCSFETPSGSLWRHCNEMHHCRTVTSRSRRVIFGLSSWRDRNEESVSISWRYHAERLNISALRRYSWGSIIQMIELQILIYGEVKRCFQWKAQDLFTNIPFVLI